MTTIKTCDNASVGILIVRDGQYLVFERATFPAGVAPAAGHVFDDHAGYIEAAHAEVAEELGLTVTHLELLPVGGWRPNRCRRQPGERGVGHQWQLYAAEVTGDLDPSQRETRNVRWAGREELQGLAYLTVGYAHRWFNDEEFAARPGLEPVWVRWMAELGIIDVSGDDLVLIEALAAYGSLAEVPR